MELGKDLSEVSGRSKFFFANTMVCLLKALEGRRVTVEIRNDFVVIGRLLSVDATMGLCMARVVMTDVKGKKTHLEQFYIQGRKIRYVQIPDEVDIVETMTWQLNKANVNRDREAQERKKLFQKKMERKATKQRRQDKKQHHSQHQRDRPQQRQHHQQQHQHHQHHQQQHRHQQQQQHQPHQQHCQHQQQQQQYQPEQCQHHRQQHQRQQHRQHHNQQYHQQHHHQQDQ